MSWRIISLPDAIIWVNHRVTEIGILGVWGWIFVIFGHQRTPKFDFPGPPQNPENAKNRGFLGRNPKTHCKVGGGGVEN